MNFKKYLSRLKKSIETKKAFSIAEGEHPSPEPEVEKRRKLPFAPTDEMLWEREKKSGKT